MRRSARGGVGSVGTLTIGNTLAFTSTANAVVDIANYLTGSYDKIVGLTSASYDGILTVQGNLVAGSYQLFTLASGTGSGAFASIIAPGFTPSFNASTGTLTLSAASGPRIWIGGTGSPNLISDGNNWQGSTAPTGADDVVFGTLGGVNLAPNTGSGAAVKNVAFDVAGYNVGGAGTLTVNGAVTANANVTISAPLELAGAGGPVAAASGATLTVSGSVSGTNGVTKTGTGTVELTAASNSYTGNTVVAEGTLKVSAGVDSNGNWAVTGDDTTVGTPAAGLDPAKFATLITEHVRQDVLTINAGSKVTISATGGAASTSVVNVLNIANSSGTFNWSVPGGDISPAATGGPVASGAAVPEPATWLLAVMAALAGLVAWRRRK